MDTISTTATPVVRHSPLQSLPIDIIWAIQDCCRAKQIGYVPGCACKAFQPTEKDVGTVRAVVRFAHAPRGRDLQVVGMV